MDAAFGFCKTLADGHEEAYISSIRTRQAGIYIAPAFPSQSSSSISSIYFKSS